MKDLLIETTDTKNYWRVYISDGVRDAVTEALDKSECVEETVTANPGFIGVQISTRAEERDKDELRGLLARLTARKNQAPEKRKYTIWMPEKPESNQYTYPRIKVCVLKQYGAAIMAKVKQLEGVNYVFLDEDAEYDDKVDVCVSNLLFIDEVGDIFDAVTRICRAVTKQGG